MNERIQLLAEQCHHRYSEHQINVDKFAELIIKECLTKCDEVQTMYGQYTFTATKCKEAIKEHFGVKE